MKEKRPLNIYISSDLIRAAKIVALQESRSVSSVVEELLQKWIETHVQNQKEEPSRP